MPEFERLRGIPGAGSAEETWTEGAASEVWIPTLHVGKDASRSDRTINPGESRLAQVYIEASDSVVLISGNKERTVDGRKTDVPVTGTGFFLTPDGKLATDFHVVAGLKDIEVKTADGRRFKATVETTDPAHDLALLKVQSASAFETFKVLPLAESSKNMGAGTLVVALGYPRGWDELFASPGKYRATHLLNDILPRLNGGMLPGEDKWRLIQEHEIHVEGGNSGGPILDHSGRVVGVVGLSNGGDGKPNDATMATPVEDLMRLLNHSAKIGASTAYSIPLTDSSRSDCQSRYNVDCYPGMGAKPLAGSKDLPSSPARPFTIASPTGGSTTDLPSFSHTAVHGVNAATKFVNLTRGTRAGLAGGLLSAALGGYDLVTRDGERFADTLEKGTTTDILKSGLQVAADGLLLAGGLASMTGPGRLGGALASLAGSGIKLADDGVRYRKLFS